MMWALIRKKIMTFEQVFTPFGLTMRIGAAWRCRWKSRRVKKVQELIFNW